MQRALGRHLQAVRHEDGAPQLEDELPDDGRVGTKAAGHAVDERDVALNWHRHGQQHRDHEKLADWEGVQNLRFQKILFENLAL